MSTAGAVTISKEHRDEQAYFRPEKSSQERGIVLLLFLGSCLYLKFFYNYTTLHSDEGIVLERTDTLVSVRLHRALEVLVCCSPACPY